MQQPHLCGWTMCALGSRIRLVADIVEELSEETQTAVNIWTFSLVLFLLDLTEAEGYSSLQEAGVRLVPHDQCRKPEVYGNHVTNDMICAGLNGCADACQVSMVKFDM